MTTCPRLGRSQGELLPSFIATAAGRAYWVDGPNFKSEMIGAMGVSFDSISTAQGRHHGRHRCRLTTIYFAEYGRDGRRQIEKTPTAIAMTAPAPIVIARGQKSINSVVVGDTSVYWAAADCTISSAAK